MKRIRVNLSFFIIGIFLASCTCSVNSKSSITTKVRTETVLFEDDFSKPLDEAIWKVEMDKQGNSSVDIEGGKMVMDTKGGVTVWLNKKLNGNVEITYKRKVVMADGENDRLSDLNQFWMATDPENENLFTRNGKFKEYDALSMYYVGFGGNENSTTRFREYQGDGERELIFELNDGEHLLTPNHWYDIKIKVEDGWVGFWVDGELFFEYKDKTPLQEGYFGFRQVWSHQEIDDFKIVEISESIQEN
ncbi:DUF6250 domain-containing protein [Echinicola salinicaeni]|uniref:DUF6250 domain-containing protein n=1 Tax=Echinicola salinicaeni TaxID=2762757 RepID=UPI0016441D12|nr:DUF6250 domain-containing protein [Echinicola salinicaeni]